MGVDKSNSEQERVKKVLKEMKINKDFIQALDLLQEEYERRYKKSMDWDQQVFGVYQREIDKNFAIIYDEYKKGTNPQDFRLGNFYNFIMDNYPRYERLVKMLVFIMRKRVRQADQYRRGYTGNWIGKLTKLTESTILAIDSYFNPQDVDIFPPPQIKVKENGEFSFDYAEDILDLILTDEERQNVNFNENLNKLKETFMEDFGDWMEQKGLTTGDVKATPPSPPKYYVYINRDDGRKTVRLLKSDALILVGDNWIPDEAKLKDTYGEDKYVNGRLKINATPKPGKDSLICDGAEVSKLIKDHNFAAYMQSKYQDFDFVPTVVDDEPEHENKVKFGA